MSKTPELDKLLHSEISRQLKEVVRGGTRDSDGIAAKLSLMRQVHSRNIHVSITGGSIEERSSVIVYSAFDWSVPEGGLYTEFKNEISYKT